MLGRQGPVLALSGNDSFLVFFRPLIGVLVLRFEACGLRPVLSRLAAKLGARVNPVETSWVGAIARGYDALNTGST